MKRWMIAAGMLAMGVVSAVRAQTGCDCGPANLQPVTLPANAVRYTGGATVLAPAPRSPVVTDAYGTVVSPYAGSPGYAAYRPLLPISSMPASYYVGRGILGQPTVYVPGQPVRNFLRYLSP